MTTDETLNELLVRLFKDIMEIEARCLVNEEFKDISYNDFHIIEAIGLKEPKSMTAVAKLNRVGCHRCARGQRRRRAGHGGFGL